MAADIELRDPPHGFLGILDSDDFDRADSGDPGTKWRSFGDGADAIASQLLELSGGYPVRVNQGWDSSTTATVATSWENGAPADDTLLLAMHRALAAPTTPTGWTQVDQRTGNGFFVTTYVRVASSAGTSVSITATGSTSSQLGIAAYTGMLTAGMVDQSQGTTAAANNNAFTGSTADTTAPFELLVTNLGVNGNFGATATFIAAGLEEIDTTLAGSAGTAQAVGLARTDYIDQYAGFFSWQGGNNRSYDIQITTYKAIGAAAVELATPFDTDDQFIEATLESGSEAGLTLRQSGGATWAATECYRFMWSASDGVFQIHRKQSDGHHVPLAIKDHTAISFPAVLRFEAVGNQLRGYYNDALVVEATDTGYDGSGYRYGGLIGLSDDVLFRRAQWGDLGRAANIVLSGVGPQEGTFEAAALVLAAQAPTFTVAPVSRSLDAAQLTLAAQTPAATPGAVTRTFDAANLTLIARDPTPQIAARSFTLEAAALVLAAQDASWTAVATRTFEAAALVLGAQDLAAAAGAVTRTLDAAELVLTARDLARAITPISLTTTEAHLALTAQDPQLSVAPITRTLDAATLALEARDPTISIAGITRIFEAAALLLIAQDLLKGLPKLEVIQVIRVLDAAQRILVTAGDQSIGGDDPGQTAEFSEAVD